MELMEIVFIIMQKPFSLASSLDQLQYVSVHCIFNHFIGFYYLRNYIYYLIQEELQANRIYDHSPCRIVKKVKNKGKSSVDLPVGVFCYLVKYVHYYKELELTMSKFYSLLF